MTEVSSRHSIGETLLSVESINLAFGEVKALANVSFSVREHEVLAIIGPNGAGKTSMLNVINGFYHPQQGQIHFKGLHRQRMKPYEAAVQGIARTFQNVALFKGMSTLNNIMTGRNLKMRRNLLWQALHLGPAREEELQHRAAAEEIIDFLEIQSIRKIPVGRLPYGLQKRVELGRALAMEPDLLLLDEPMAGMNMEEKQDMCRFSMAPRSSSLSMTWGWSWISRIAWWCWITDKRLPRALRTKSVATKLSLTPTWA